MCVLRGLRQELSVQCALLSLVRRRHRGLAEHRGRIGQKSTLGSLAGRRAGKVSAGAPGALQGAGRLAAVAAQTRARPRGRRRTHRRRSRRGRRSRGCRRRAVQARGRLVESRVPEAAQELRSGVRVGQRSEGVQGPDGGGEGRGGRAGGGGRGRCCRDADVWVVMQRHVRVERVR